MVASILLTDQSRVSHPSIAPDARYVAFTTNGSTLQLYDAGSGAVRELVRNTFPRLSRFSPDGRWLVFEENTGLSIVQIPDGAPARLTDAGATPSWMDDEWIAFNQGDGIYRVSRVSQRVEPLWEPAETDTFRLDHPFVLPGAQEALVSIVGTSGSSIGLLDLGDGDVRLLARQAIAPSYVASGHLLFTEQPGAVNHNGRLFAQPFDPESGETRGPAVPVLSNRGFWEVGVSDNGDLVTSAGIAAGLTSAQDQLRWLDPETGATTMIDRVLPDVDALGLSPDGETLWYRTGQDGQVFVGPLDPNGGSPLEIARGAFGGALLSADSLYFHRGSISTRLETYVRSVAGSEAERRVSFLGRPFEGIWDLAADGRTAVVLSGDTWEGDSEMFLVTLDDRSRSRLPIEPRAESVAISPDRRWLSYRISTDGSRHFIAGTDGSGPWEVASQLQGSVWLNDSRSLLMRDATGLYVVELATARGVRPTGPPRLVYSGTSEMWYVVNRATGQVLLADRVSADRGMESRLDLIIAWGERLKQEAPVR